MARNIGFQTLLPTLLAVTFYACLAQPANAVVLEWTRQIGTSVGESETSVSADGLGNVYIAGATEGSLGGSNAGSRDAFISKFDTSGNWLWTRQLGASGTDVARGVSADGLGNVYIAGNTDSSLGGPNAGGYDAFVTKFDASGNFLWTRQLGTPDGEFAYGVSADGLGNVYIAGSTEGSLGGPFAGWQDAFVSKYSASGTLLWTRQLGSSLDDGGSKVSADGLGNVYIAGYTTGNLGGSNAGGNDAFVSRFDASGNWLWTRQVGSSSSDLATGVSADGLGNVYIAGFTQGSLDGSNAGSLDAFISKFDATGNLLWTRQLGTSSSDAASGVSADGLGNVYISGNTAGSLGGPNAGVSDGFVSKFDDSGNLLWTQQFGTSSSERGADGVKASADGLGNVYVSGDTQGSLGGPNAGGYDAFVAKYNDTATATNGDFNNDGTIDAADYVVWRKSIGTPAALNTWRVHFGEPAGSGTTGSASVNTPVPEPSCLALFAVAALLFTRRCAR